MIREGFVRNDLEAVAPLSHKIKDFRNVILVSDTFSPEVLVEGRGLNFMVQKAIKYGFDPIVAVQLASLNPATYFSLNHLGAIAVGRKADLFLAEGFDDLMPKLVVAGGSIVARNGRLAAPIPVFSYPAEARSTIALATIDESSVRSPAVRSGAIVKAVSILNETVTQELHVTLPTKDGFALPDPQQDVAKMVVFNRQKRKPQGSVGFLHGLGLKEGAVATTMIWDTANVLAIGVTDADLVTAVNRLLHNGGGWVVCQKGKILAEIAFPVFGLISDMSLPYLVDHMQELDSNLKRLGVRLNRPFLTLQTLPFTGLPFLRLTDKGLLDVRLGKFVPLLV
jgi:adenine deaminase